MSTKVEVMTRLEDLVPLEDGWEGLRLACQASVFTSYLWTYTWLKHFQDVVSTRVLVLRDGQGLRGIAPLVTHRSRFMRYPVTYLSLAGNMGETAEYHDLQFLYAGDHEEAARDFVKGMARIRWNLLQLRDLRWNAFADELFEQSCARWQCEKMVSRPCPFVTLDPSIDVLDQFEARSSRKVKRIIDSLDKEGRIDFVSSRTGDMVSRSIETYIRLHKARWESKGGSIFQDPRQANFLREIASKCAERRKAAVYEVHIDGKVASQQLCIMDGDIVRMYKIGMDDQFRNFAPGYLSVYFAMREAQKDGYKEFDLGPGPEEYKYKVGGKDRFTYAIQGKRGSMIMLSRASHLPGVRRVAGIVMRTPHSNATTKAMAGEKEQDQYRQ